jgi:hypothetical protein
MNPSAVTAWILPVNNFFRIRQQIIINSLILSVIHSQHQFKGLILGENITDMFTFYAVLDSPSVAVPIGKTD